MTVRRDCCPRPGLPMTRRRFGALIKATALTGLTARLTGASASDPDFTLVVVPDPQFLCSSLYRGLMSWVLKNQSSAGSLSLNIKAVLGVGDCVNNPDTPEADKAQSGWSLLDANGFPWITPPGNHDMVGGLDLSARRLANNFMPGGFFSADQRANQKYWGSSLPGDGGYSTWGGSYDSANYYVRLIVGSRKLLLLSIEFHPRSMVLNWAKSIHDAFPDHECIVTTHSYLSDMGDLGRGPGDPGVTQYNNDDYNIGPAPAANSGYKMWHGSNGIPPWPGLSAWSNVTMVLGGHFVYGGWHDTGPYKPRHWQRVSVPSQSARKQDVQQIYANWQDMEPDTQVYCVGGGDGRSDVAHLFLLKFRPSIETLEGYALSTNNGLWCDGPAGAAISPDPVRLFSVAYPGIEGPGQRPKGMPPDRRHGPYNPKF